MRRLVAALGILIGVIAGTGITPSHPVCHHHAGRHHRVCVQPGGPNLPVP